MKTSGTGISRLLAHVHVWSLICPETDLCTYMCTFMVRTLPGDQLIKYPVLPSLPPNFRLTDPVIQNIDLAIPKYLVNGMSNYLDNYDHPPAASAVAALPDAASDTIYLQLYPISRNLCRNFSFYLFLILRPTHSTAIEIHDILLLK